jgi:integrase
VPRHPMQLGTWGTIRSYPMAFNAKGKPVSWRAMTLFRGPDGRTRSVERRGRSAADAQNRLKAHLAEGARLAGGGELNGLDRFSKAAELWRAGIEAQVYRDVRSPGTLETYERHLTLHVLPALGDVRLLEFSPPLIDRFLKGVSSRTGAPTAKTCRSVVSGVLGLAVRYGALPSNPVRDADRLGGRPRREPRALTVDERVRLFTALDHDAVALAADVPGLLRFMLATGLRIGECLGVLWFEMDLQAARVDVSSTVIRWSGHGLVRKTTKSKAGQRSLLMPSWMVTELQTRFSGGVRMDEPVFADSLGGLRDPKNTRRDIRHALDRAGFRWVTSHNFRKTTATLLDQAGLSARVIADQLGHARPSMTQDVYMGRKVVDSRAVEALEEAFGGAEFSSAHDEPLEGKDVG